jgi:poly(3-hydroxybutyrate) depolymerase
MEVAPRCCDSVWLAMRNAAPLLLLAVAAFTPVPAAAQAPAGTMLEETVAPGRNYDKAEFRLWLPKGVEAVQAILVLVPGSNGDGRGQVDDPVWQDFAVHHQLALVGLRLTDKPHDQGFIEEYVNVSQGSGQAFLDAMTAFASRARHPELATAPFLLWGMSAGGEFNYEFVCWKPERVVAFVVNKGNIYYTALAPKAARSVPGILFTGGKDLEFRTSAIAGLFAMNRRGGALWAIAEEPSAAHVVGRSRDVALALFEDTLALRVGDGPGLKAIVEKSGFIGDIKAKTFQALGEDTVPNYPTAWLPTARVAERWQWLVTEKP